MTKKKNRHWLQKSCFKQTEGPERKRQKQKQKQKIVLKGQENSLRAAAKPDDLSLVPGT